MLKLGVNSPYTEIREFEPEVPKDVRNKIRKRLPKDSEDSDPSEYKTVESGDEDRKGSFEKEVGNLSYQQSLATFEYYEEIHYIEEYENNLVGIFFRIIFQTSRTFDSLITDIELGNLHIQEIKKFFLVLFI